MDVNPAEIEASEEAAHSKLESVPEEVRATAAQASYDLVEAFERNAARGRKWAKGFKLVLLTICVAFIVLSNIGNRSGFELVSFRLFLCTIFAMYVAGWFVAYSLKRKWVAVFESQADRRSIPTLINVLSNKESGLIYGKRPRRLAIEALIRLLPELCASGEDVLTTAQRSALAEIATVETDVNLVMAIVEVLATFGREESVRSLQKMENRQVQRNDSEVHEAARRALVQVRERVELDKLHGALLRAAEGGPDQEASLVRPSFGPVETDASKLLRAPNNEESCHVSS